MSRMLFGVAALTLALTLAGCAKKEEKEKAAREAEAARAGLRDRLLAAHHDKCVELFVKTDGFGRGRMVVMQHPSPSYPKSLELPAQGPAIEDDGTPVDPRPVTWVMDRVELVSLLNQETPGVYAAEGVAMFGRKRPKTRDLDSFEAAALPQLRSGEAVRVQESEGEVRVLGAIRARAECKGCHAKHEVGSLLGAFTYVFKPAAVPAP